MFAGNFNPRGWSFCDGQLLSISQNQALFSLLGTTYGGDGRTNFALPELRGRVPVHAGSGPGLTPRSLGERSGTETNTLTVGNLAAHTHSGKVAVSSKTGSRTTPVDSFLAPEAGGTINLFRPSATANTFMGAGSVVNDNTGSNTPVNNMQPYLVVNYIIALEGIFPSRN